MIRKAVPILSQIPYGKKYYLNQIKSLKIDKDNIYLKDRTIQQVEKNMKNKELESYVKDFLRESL